MASTPQFKDDEEREISRGGKTTALFTMGMAVFVIAGGIALALGLQQLVKPPLRPGAASAINGAGKVQPPSP